MRPLVRDDPADGFEYLLRVLDIVLNELPVRVVRLVDQHLLKARKLSLKLELLLPRPIPFLLLLACHWSGDADGAGLHVDDDVVGMRQWLRYWQAAASATLDFAFPLNLVGDGRIEPLVVQLFVSRFCLGKELREQALSA
jgi:hypothetical protein